MSVIHEYEIFPSDTTEGEYVCRGHRSRFTSSRRLAESLKQNGWRELGEFTEEDLAVDDIDVDDIDIRGSILDEPDRVFVRIIPWGDGVYDYEYCGFIASQE